MFSILKHFKKNQNNPKNTGNLQTNVEKSENLTDNSQLKLCSKTNLLLVQIFVVSTCSLIYELLIGTTVTNITSNSVLAFSLAIGLFLAGLGSGAFFSSFVKDRFLVSTFILVESFLALAGGFVPVLLYGTLVFSPYFSFVQIILTLLIGFLSGLEIPILTRILNNSQKFQLSSILAKVLSFDYLGGLAASLLFPLVFLPYFGLVRLGFVTGIVNCLMAILALWIFWKDLKNSFLGKFGHSFLILTILIILIFGAIWSSSIYNFLENQLYRDPIIYSTQTPYQRIVLTKKARDVRLFLNGGVQFSSLDEYRYHESLVMPAMLTLLNSFDNNSSQINFKTQSDKIQNPENMKNQFGSEKFETEEKNSEQNSKINVKKLVEEIEKWQDQGENLEMKSLENHLEIQKPKLETENKLENLENFENKSKNECIKILQKSLNSFQNSQKNEILNYKSKNQVEILQINQPEISKKNENSESDSKANLETKNSNYSKNNSEDLETQNSFKKSFKNYNLGCQINQNNSQIPKSDKAKNLENQNEKIQVSQNSLSQNLEILKLPQNINFIPNSTTNSEKTLEIPRLQIVVFGGGDGLAVRELLKFDKYIERIYLVDIDKQITDLATNTTILSDLNQNSLKNPKVEIINADAWGWIQNQKNAKFDLIINDFPDPDDNAIAKLYSQEFYKFTHQKLTENGLIVTQSSSPYTTPKAFWGIHQTMKSVFAKVLPYSVYVPSFGLWGFQIASKNSNFEPNKSQLSQNIEPKKPSNYSQNSSKVSLSKISSSNFLHSQNNFQNSLQFAKNLQFQNSLNPISNSLSNHNFFPNYNKSQFSLYQEMKLFSKFTQKSSKMKFEIKSENLEKEVKNEAKIETKVEIKSQIQQDIDQIIQKNQFVNTETLPKLFILEKDLLEPRLKNGEIVDIQNLKINTLDNLILTTYYTQSGSEIN